MAKKRAEAHFSGIQERLNVAVGELGDTLDPEPGSGSERKLAMREVLPPNRLAASSRKRLPAAADEEERRAS